MQVDSFAKTRKAVVIRPPAPACAPGCHYAPDWTGVQQILALGPVAGGVPGTFGGKTWLVDLAPSAEYAERFDVVIAGKSGEVLPTLW